MPSCLSGPLLSLPPETFGGRITPPGDKSISHRALVLGAISIGETLINGASDALDVRATASVAKALGAGVMSQEDGRILVHGLGTGAFQEPENVLDFGNSGTSVRLWAGALAGCPFPVFMTGDRSLRSRPMGRIIEPLSLAGVSFISRTGGFLPVVMTGTDRLLPIEYRLPIPSAQIKSAILLAGLAARGKSSVIEPVACRDHTERMLPRFGASLCSGETGEGHRIITINGGATLRGTRVDVPGDPSSAAFPLAAAAILTGREVIARKVLVNPLRDRFFARLSEMGADVTLLGRQTLSGEPVADVRVRGARLEGIVAPPEEAAAMIDEYPLLAVVAAFARGRTVMRGIGELRVKESDRIASIVAGLRANGVSCEEFPDGLEVTGHAGPPPGGGHVLTRDDHRIAMAFLVMGTGARSGVSIDEARMTATSYPGFVEMMTSLGARIRIPETGRTRRQ